MVAGGTVRLHRYLRPVFHTARRARRVVLWLVYPDDMSVMLELNTDLWTQQTGLERIASVTNLLSRAAESPGKRLSQQDGMVR